MFDLHLAGDLARVRKNYGHRSGPRYKCARL